MPPILLVLAFLAGDSRPAAAPPERPAVGAYSASPPAEPSTDGASADDRQWWALTTHPGYYGFGRKNAAGAVVSEFHRFGEYGEIRPGPAPDSAQPRQPAAFASPPAAQGGCAGGQCGAAGFYYQRGFLGFR